MGLPNSLLREIGMRKLELFANRLKASNLPAAAAHRLIDHAKFDPRRDSTPIPFSPDQWRRISGRYDLSDLCGSRGWIPVLNILNSPLITTPYDLSRLTRTEMVLLAAESTDQQLICQLWKAACAQEQAPRPPSRAALSVWNPPIIWRPPFEAS